MFGGTNQRTSVFYTQMESQQEVCSGYLIKSPPSRTMSILKSWKRRFFVLSKMGECNHLLQYFNSAEERTKPLGKIDLSLVLQFFSNPRNHPKWPSIDKLFKCSSDCVLYMKLEDREYFFIGQTSSDIHSWCLNIFTTQKHRPHRIVTQRFRQTVHPPTLCKEKRSQSEPEALKDGKPPMKCKKLRPKSEPVPLPNSTDELSDDVKSPKMTDMWPFSKSEYQTYCPKINGYDYPRKYSYTVLSEEDHGRFANGYMSYDELHFIKTSQNSLEQCDNEIYEVMNSPGLLNNSDEILRQKRADVDGMDDLRRTTSALIQQNVMEELKQEHSAIERGLQRKKKSPAQSSAKPKLVEKNISLNHEDFNSYLTLEEKEGQLCVSECKGQPQLVEHFHKGDQILAINNLKTESLQDVEIYLSKLLKSQLKVTVRRSLCDTTSELCVENPFLSCHL